MNDSNREFKTLLNKSRLIVQELRELDDWHANVLLDEQMEILKTMEKMLQNQLTPTTDPPASSRTRSHTAGVATVRDHQRSTTRATPHQPTKKRKHEPETNSEDDHIDEYSNEHQRYEEIQDRFHDQQDDLKRKKQDNANLRRQLQKNQ